MNKVKVVFWSGTGNTEAMAAAKRLPFLVHMAGVTASG